MKIRLLILTLSIPVFISSMAQNQLENLKKYWCYRDRLRNDFIVVDQNVEHFGVNIPASEIDHTRGEVRWDDGNMNMSHYLSVLATELWLLKNNNQDYTLTLKELFYAMLAMERLDLYSEKEWRVPNYRTSNSSSGINTFSTDRNGCHIRDDVSDGFWLEHQGHFMESKYVSVFNRLSGNSSAIPKEVKDYQREEISQDVIYHNLEGLALIASLVGTESVASIPVTFVRSSIPNYLNLKGIKSGDMVNFSLWAKDFVKRYIKFMQSGGQTWRLKLWPTDIGHL